MEDPWQTATGRDFKARRGAGRTESMARFAPRWSLPLAVLGALIALAVLFLSAVPAAADQPTAPGNLAVAPGNAKLVVGWNPPENVGDSETISYTVQHKATAAADSAATSESYPATGWVSLQLTSAETHAEITGLTNGVSYDVRVKTSQGEESSPWSATMSATPQEDAIWAAILTVSVDENGANLGCTGDAPSSGDMDPCTGALTEDEFEFGGVTYQWTRVSELKVNGGGGIKTYVFTPGVSADSGLRQGRLQVGNDTIHLDDDPDGIWWRTDGDGFLVFGTYSEDLDWFTATGQRIPLSLYAEANPATLPDNLSFTVSKGSMTTDLGPSTSTRVTIAGDCPPNGGGLRFHVTRAGMAWPAEAATSDHKLPDALGYSQTRDCGDIGSREITAVSVDGIDPGEKWEMRVYVWRSSDGEASDFSQVYYVIGWRVPETPAGLNVTAGVDQLSVEWDEITAVGTDMPVTTHIRWRTAQVGQSGETDYAAAGPWNNDDGMATDGPISHTITGLAAGTVYDVEVRAASPMGSSEWSAVNGETQPPTDDSADNAESTQRSAPVPVVTFGHQQTGEGEYWVSVNEGDELTVTLIFTPALSKDTSIRWYTALHHGEHGNGAEHYGTEESNWLQLRSDFVYNDSAAARDVELTAGMTSATFNIKTVEDSEIEGNETFHVHLCGPPPRCEWTYAPPEPHPGRARILASLEASKDDYQSVKSGPELLVTILDDDEPEN